MQDPRITQANRLIQSIIPKVDLPYSKIMITEDNTLVIIVRDTVFFTTKITDIQPGFPIAFYFTALNLDTFEFENDLFLLNEMRNLYNIYSSIEIPNNCVVTSDELRGNEEFERLIGLKSADGLNFLKIFGNNIGETYYIPIFSGFPNVTKNDKMNVSIFSIKDQYYYIIYHIFKKKINRYIQMHFKTLNLNEK